MQAGVVRIDVMTNASGHTILITTIEHGFGAYLDVLTRIKTPNISKDNFLNYLRCSQGFSSK